MRGFTGAPEFINSPTEMTARILREIAMASEAGAAEIRFRFLQNWKPKNALHGARGLGVHIECGRSDYFLLVSETSYTNSRKTTLPMVLEALATLVARAREACRLEDHELTNLIDEISDGL
jgi:hypothetical protein